MKLALAEAFRTCVQAAFASDTSIKTLIIDTATYDIDTGLQLDDMLPGVLEDVITSVDAFDIKAFMYYDADADDFCQGLVALNSLATKANSYTVGCPIFPFRWTALLEPFDGLRLLGLSLMFLEEDTLIDMMRHQVNTLTSLSLQDVSMTSLQSWRDVLAFIADMPHLLYLYVVDLGVVADEGGDYPHLDKSWTAREDARRDIKAFADSLGVKESDLRTKWLAFDGTQ